MPRAARFLRVEDDRREGKYHYEPGREPCEPGTGDTSDRDLDKPFQPECGEERKQHRRRHEVCSDVGDAVDERVSEEEPEGEADGCEPDGAAPQQHEPERARAEQNRMQIASEETQDLEEAVRLVGGAELAHQELIGACRDVLAQAASAASAQLNVDPALLDRLSGATITVRRERIVLDELALLLGVRLGLSIEIDAGRLVVRAGRSGQEARLLGALALVDYAMVGHPEPRLTPHLRFERAVLLFWSGRAADATLAFSDFVSAFPGHEKSAEARLLAIVAALRAGLHAEAAKNLASIEESSEGIPAVPGAALLPARVRAAQGELADAALHARKAAAMRRTSAASGSGETNSRHSLATTCSAVAGCASSRSSTPSPSKRAVRPRMVFSPRSCSSGRNTNAPVSRSRLQPENARAASFTSRSP